MLQAKHGNGYWQQSVAESDQLMLISDESNIHPEWYYSGGFVELQTVSGTTVDFVSFGENAYLPTDASQWQAGNNAAPMEEDLGMSVVRTALDSDTNSAQDWQVSYYMTPGGQNDVACNTDDDNDGIDDASDLFPLDSTESADSDGDGTVISIFRESIGFDENGIISLMSGLHIFFWLYLYLHFILLDKL